MGDYVLTVGSASISELADRFSVSQMTAYRDVDFLEAQGLMRKTRGGVARSRPALSRAASAIA